VVDHPFVGLFVVITREIDVVLVADEEQVVVGGGWGFNETVVIVLGQLFPEEIGEDFVAVAAEGVSGAKVIFLQLLAI